MVNSGMVSGLTRKARQGKAIQDKADKSAGCPCGRGGSRGGRVRIPTSIEDEMRRLMNH